MKGRSVSLPLEVQRFAGTLILFNSMGRVLVGGAGNRRVEHIAQLCVPIRARYLCYRMKKDWVVDAESKVPDYRKSMS